MFTILLLACAGGDRQSPDIVDDGSLMRIAEGSADAMGVLGFLNDSGTTLELLDDTVGLDKRAATSLIEHRDGEDETFGTSDDALFASIAQVDAQYYVGDAAMEALLAYADAQGWVPGPDDVVGSWEGVSFTASQVTAVLGVVNTATQPALDDDAALDSRAAQNIVDTRPFVSIDELGAVSYVGPSALRKLQSYAASLALAQVGEDCELNSECADGLMCAGAIVWGTGVFCTDTWGVFSWEGPQSIPEGSELLMTVDVQGLASVPVDVVLTLRIDHDRPADLELSIDNFNGYGETLWTGGDADPELEMVVYAFPSDDMVHGEYNVRLTDTIAGVEGEVLGWDLLVVSVYD